MTTANYIKLITNSTLTLVKDNATEADQATLGENEYFVIMFCTSHKSYLRNYVQYKNLYNYNTARKVYDIDIDKYAFYQGYYISKYFRKRHDPDKGRTIIVSVNVPAAVIDLDDERIMVRGLTDYDDNKYTTVIINGQEWTVENYKTEHYENGAIIPMISNDLEFLDDVSGACCCYENDLTYKNTYGLLYNYYSLINPNGFVYLKRDGIKEEGWRLPTMIDIINLCDFGSGILIFGGYAVIGGKLKEVGTTHWIPPNTDASDEYGWKGLGCGNRFIDTFDNEGYRNKGIFADFFTSETIMNFVATFYLMYDASYLIQMVSPKYCALNVKLVKDL